MTTDVPRTVTLDELRAQYRAQGEEAERLANSLDADTANRRPPAGGWSVAECLRHLTITAEQYHPALTAGIGRARATSHDTDGPFALSWVARRMVGSMEPPPRMRMRAPRAFLPPGEPTEDSSALPWPATHEAYRSALERTDALLVEARGVDLARVRVTSPVSRLLRMSGLTAFAFMAAHERRHLWQAAQVARAVKRR